MIEDMTMRNFAPRTQKDYIRAAKSFSAFLGASPDTVRFEDLLRFRLQSGLEQKRCRDGATMGHPH